MEPFQVFFCPLSLFTVDEAFVGNIEYIEKNALNLGQRLVARMEFGHVDKLFKVNRAVLRSCQGGCSDRIQRTLDYWGQEQDVEDICVHEQSDIWESLLWTDREWNRH